MVSLDRQRERREETARLLTGREEERGQLEVTVTAAGFYCKSVFGEVGKDGSMLHSFLRRGLEIEVFYL